MKNITARHRRFVEQYCTHFNGAQAVREAGYAESRAKQTAYDLLQDVDINRMIQNRLDEMSMSAEEATKRLADIARADITQFFQVKTVSTDDGPKEVLTLDHETFLEEAGAVVKEITWDQNGRPKLKLYDKQKALKTILDAHGAFEHDKHLNVQGLGEFLADAFDDDE